ncbi:MAG: hypothetical protein ACYC9V_03790 [Desulfobacteria bacterium]
MRHRRIKASAALIENKAPEAKDIDRRLVAEDAQTFQRQAASFRRVPRQFGFHAVGEPREEAQERVREQDVSGVSSANSLCRTRGAAGEVRQSYGAFVHLSRSDASSDESQLLRHAFDPVLPCLSEEIPLSPRETAGRIEQEGSGSTLSRVGQGDDGFPGPSCHRGFLSLEVPRSSPCRLVEKVPQRRPAVFLERTFRLFQVKQNRQSVSRNWSYRFGREEPDEDILLPVAIASVDHLARKTARPIAPV